MERKLASIQQISKLTPIEGADRIEQATCLGWSVVVRKGEFKEGDLCVFFEIDSILPDKEWAKFLEAKKFRVKTAKFKGVLAQGLALPITILPLYCDPSTGELYRKIGDDITAELDVGKYDLPLPQDQEICGPFPGELPKTDEIRLQSIPAILNEVKDVPLVVTVKLDGTSCTIFKKDGELIVCGRNWRIREGNNKYWEVARKYKLAEVLPEGFAVQGEVVGPGIQNNRLGLKNVDFFVFDVYSTGIRRHFNNSELHKYCSELGLRTVPVQCVLQSGDVDRPETIDEWLKFAEGKYSGTSNVREGIVVRPTCGGYSSVLKSRSSFKVINNSFLLRYEE